MKLANGWTRACRAALIGLGLLVGLATAAAAGPPAGQTAEPAGPGRKTAVQRLSLEFMQALDRDRSALAEQVKPIDVPYRFERGTFHFHSRLSHDSEGTIQEIVEAAKATGTRIVGFTEHPSQSVDVVAENVQGWRDGVYFLAGTEQSNTLLWPGREGALPLRFVAHPEGVPTFDRHAYAGMEIYNTHSDAMDEPISVLMAGMIANISAVKAHPEAAFCSFLDWPKDFLARFDRLTAAGRFSGIAANDSHQNQGLRIVALPDGGVEVVDQSGAQIWQADGLRAKMLLAALGQQEKPAERLIVLDVQLDPYEISMRHVGTFLRIDTIDEHSVREALASGRVVLGFEIIAPLPAFGFWVEQNGTPIGTVGDQVSWRPGTTLRVKLPASAQIRVVRNGVPFAVADGDTLVLESVPAGVYRMDAGQQLAGEQYPWVITNPIYVGAYEE